MTESTRPAGNQTTLNSDGLKRTIGVWGQSANIVNQVVGAGIFVLPAVVAAGLTAYLICGFLITLIMLTFIHTIQKKLIEEFEPDIPEEMMHLILQSFSRLHNGRSIMNKLCESVWQTVSIEHR